MTLTELVRVSEASRVLLTGTHGRVSHALDLPSRIKASLLGGSAKWLGGSLAAGVLAVLIFKKKKRSEPKRRGGLLISLVMLGFAMGKPLAKAYALKMLKDYLEARRAVGLQGRYDRKAMPPY